MKTHESRERITYEDLPRAGMVTDLRYQQPLMERKVANILRNGFNPEALGTVVVSRRDDGVLAILDGQHRMESGTQSGYADLYHCEVHHGLTIKQEAELFLKLNTQFAPTSITKFLARVTAGEEVPLRIEAILSAHGWRIERGSAAGTVAAVDSIERVYRTAGRTLPNGKYEAVTEKTVDALTRAWGTDTSTTAGALVEGVAQLFGRFGESVDVERLVTVLRRVTPHTVLARARGTKDALSGTLPAHVGRVVHGLYNDGLRSRSLPDWTWNR